MTPTRAQRIALAMRGFAPKNDDDWDWSTYGPADGERWVFAKAPFTHVYVAQTSAPHTFVLLARERGIPCS